MKTGNDPQGGLMKRFQEHPDNLVFVCFVPGLQSQVSVAATKAKQHLSLMANSSITEDVIYSLVGSYLRDEGLDFHANRTSYGEEWAVRFWIHSSSYKDGRLGIVVRVPKCTWVHSESGKDVSLVSKILRRRKAV